MKHRLYIIGAVILYIILVFIGIDINLPGSAFGGDLSLDLITRDEDGNIYGLGSSSRLIFVYEMDSEGNPCDLLSLSSETDEIEVMCRYNDDTLYVGQIWYEDSYQNFSIWSKNDNSNVFERVWHESFEDDVEITEFYVEDGVMYVVGIDIVSKDIIICCKGEEIDTVYRFPNDFIPVKVCYGNNGLYILSMDNKVFYSTLDGVKTKLDIDDATIIMTDENGYYYRKKNQEELIYKLYNGLEMNTFTDLGDVWYIIRSDVAGNNAVLSYFGDEDQLMIVSQDDGIDIKYINSFKLGFITVAKKCIIPVLLVTMCYASIIILFYLFKKLVWNRKRLRYQTMAVQGLTSGIWIIIMLIMLRVYNTYSELQDRLQYAYICTCIQEGRLESEVNIKDLDFENYIGSVQQEKIEQIFEYDVTGSTWQQYFTRQEIVYGYDNPVFMFADIAAYGTQVDTYYNSRTVNNIKECIATGEGFGFNDTISGRSNAVFVVPIGNSEQQLCLVVRIPFDVGESTHGDISGFYIVLIVGWVLTMLFLRFFLKKRWKFMDTLVAQMDRVSRGEYRIDQKKVPDNEFGNMWTSLERMCKNIQLQKYKQTDTLEYVNQFAPKNFERLFEKDRLQDIEVGETLQISATMGIISIIDRDTLLTGKLQRQYVQYVNQLMEILFSQEQSNQAIFIQNGSNLENVKVIFKSEEGSEVTAVRYSIDCIETLLGLTKSQYDTKPFIMLHTSSFSCGVAGGSRQVYPFVTSLEMETLSTYIEPLKACGVRMVVTQSTWEKIKDKVKSRYIGYVKSYKLYEILDACSQTQELGRLKNKDNFDKALKCYYENSLYEARNMFSDIVRECPDDGIARWYAFACDELFNRENGSDAHYELFWTMF